MFSTQRIFSRLLDICHTHKLIRTIESVFCTLKKDIFLKKKDFAISNTLMTQSSPTDSVYNNKAKLIT